MSSNLSRRLGGTFMLVDGDLLKRRALTLLLESYGLTSFCGGFIQCFSCAIRGL